jgi:hypothetical protein
MTSSPAASTATPFASDVPGRVDLTVTVPVAADQRTAFTAITDWAAQGRWMLGTRVWVSKGTGRTVGDELSGFTGVGRIGFLDTMTITEFRDDLVVVEHTGKVVRGAGWMGADSEDGATRFVWGEAVDLPFGVLGRLGWLVVKPILALAVRRSLQRLAALVAAGSMPPVGNSTTP